MSDRYRYPRPRSPTYNPARASLPINISGWASDHHHDHHDHHSHAVPPSRRDVYSSSGTRGSGGVVTTYKVKTDPPSRASSTRARRSSTMDSSNRPPAIITTTNRALRPVIHSGGARPVSPVRNPYRSSEEEYYSVPASSQHGHHHRKRYSATMDNADMSRLADDRDANRLRIGGGREGTLYVGTRARPAPSYTSSGRRTDVDEYGEDGYGYTGPRDLVQYDLNNSTPRYNSRRDSNDGSRSARPTSISGYNDIVPRSYDARERGPPPSTRGFDRIPERTSTWGQPAVRLPVVPMAPVERPAPVEPMEPIRRTGSARPASMYHDSRDPRRGDRSRDDRYEVRDDDRRPHRSETFDDKVEQRGFGIRTDQPDREREQRSERSERVERSDRPPRSDRDRYGRDHSDEDRSEHKGRDALATGMSIAGAAMGLTAAKNSISNRDDDRDERRRDKYDEDVRRQREREERDSRDVDPRDSKERRYRDDDKDRSPRDYPRDLRDPRDSRDLRDTPPSSRDPRDIPPPSRDSPPSSAYVDQSGRDPRDQLPPSRSDRDRDVEPSRRDRRLHPDHGSSAIDSGPDASDDALPPRIRRESRSRRESQGPQAFNPKDTMDLKALKDALNAKDAAAPPRIPPKEPLSPPHRTPRTSMSRDPREVDIIRTTLEDDRRARNLSNPDDGKQLRVVSPPRDKVDEKPLKSILRQPRAAFPEDPSPVREGVAPLKDARKDGVPPDARWTKISRKLVNPEALEAGKERYEAREDFVIVLRVLSRDEVQGYAEVTQRIRAAREEAEALEREERRRARRERHRRERNGELPPRRRRRRRDRESGPGDRDGGDSESDTTEDEDYYLDGPSGRGDDRVRDAPGSSGRRRIDDGSAVMSGGLGEGDRAPR